MLALILLAAAWWGGALDRIVFWAMQEQREFQTGIARSLRAMRAGDPGAISILLGACFAYGVVHAAGPGHGKVLIGGYGFARRVPVVRLSVIALLASLGQALMAVVLVAGGVLLFEAGRQTLVDTAEALLAPFSYGAIGLIGLWLAVRGARRLLARSRAHDHHHHHHSGEAACGSCGHAHGPSLDQVDRVKSLREAAVLIAGIAVRPCTGALFVLIITWQMGIFGVGILGAFSMAVGTAVLTIGVGLAARGLGGGALAALTGSPGMARAMAGMEVVAGGLIAIVATGLLLRAI